MIWLIGSKGMLGSEVARQLTQNKFEFTGTDKEVDITNPDALESYEKSIITSFYDLDKNIPEDKGMDIKQSSAKDILEYLSKPIETCKYCTYEYERWVPWKISEGDINEWIYSDND